MRGRVRGHNLGPRRPPHRRIVDARPRQPRSPRRHRGRSRQRRRRRDPPPGAPRLPRGEHPADAARGRRVRRRCGLPPPGDPAAARLRIADRGGLRGGGHPPARLARRARRRERSRLDRRTLHIASLSSRTLVYKGMLTAEQLERFYPDLRSPSMASALAIVHARFSTNVLPRWDLAQPARMSAHNGEINTLRGNAAWMAARESKFRSALFGGDVEKLRDVLDASGSDSTQFDNALELLTMSGRSVEHAIMMMIPEAWHGNDLIDDDRRAFYEFHASLLEPWDGPAAIAFTDGRLVGACLDRNGLRPARYLVTDDGLVLMASEPGVLDIPEERIVKKWRLDPGRLLLVDTEAGAILDDDACKTQLVARHPYAEWISAGTVHLDELPRAADQPEPDSGTVRIRQQLFGCTEAALRLIVAHVADSGRVRSASRQVFQIIEEERMRIARDMHDGPAQSMANLVLQAEILERLIQRDPLLVVKELADFKDGVRAVLEDTRRLIFDLRPMTLDDLGLVPTLRKFVKEFGDKSGVNAQLRVMGEEARLPGAYERTIFRIVEEALNNARKHAAARNVEGLVNFQPDGVTTVIRDDGVGMDVAAVEARLGGGKNLGLISMRERAELEKGTLEIRSELARGTEIRAVFHY